MSFLTLPPDAISALMFSGAGSGPMLSAAAAWGGLAAELDSAAEAFISVTSGLTGQAWQGPASQAMAAAAQPYAGWLSAAASHASGAASQATAVAGVFESALAATVHPTLVAANRSDFVSLIMSNLFGQNAPAIAATEGVYEEMWAQDVAAMVGYHGGASAAAEALTSAAAGLAPNFGYGNVGSGNYGFFNTGSSNFGIGNLSPNFDVAPNIFGGAGLLNNGMFNVGIGNTGTANVGIGNLSPNFAVADPSHITTFGNLGLLNAGLQNTGIGNIGTSNQGLPAPLLGLLGVGNHGDFNQGLFNTGSYNTGIGLTGDHLVGIGPLHITGA